MTKPEFTVGLIKEPIRLQKLAELLTETTAFALDIETADWWNRHQERVALIQIAFRFQGQIKVAVIDALAGLDLACLRDPLQNPSIIKVIHNASFDATRLARHYNFRVAPIHDTMAAARRSGEKKYSLRAQALLHLNLALDKSLQNSDWSHRPLDYRQMSYAANDPCATLLLYEHQARHNLTGDYRLKPPVDASRQAPLPLDETPPVESVKASITSSSQNDKTAEKSHPVESNQIESNQAENEPNAIAASLLGIVAELPLRYSSDGLAVSLAAERVGMAGWIVDQQIGRDTELDEETVKLTIADLCERGLVRINDRRRLEATGAGARLWRQLKSNHNMLHGNSTRL